MKKLIKTLMAVAAMLIAVGANAQLGVKVGYVSTSFKTKGDVRSSRSRHMSGVKVGLDYDLYFGPTGLSFRPGVNYTYFGQGEKLEGNTFQQRYHFLNVPLDFKYSLSLHRLAVYAFAGPRLVMGVAGPFIEKGNGFKFVSDDFSGKFTNKNGDNTETGHRRASLNRFDIELGAGIGVQFYGMSLELGYDWGLLNLQKYERKNFSTRRNQINVTLGYAF